MSVSLFVTVSVVLCLISSVTSYTSHEDAVVAELQNRMALLSHSLRTANVSVLRILEFMHDNVSDVVSSSPGEVSGSAAQCVIALGLVLQGIVELKYWALQMFDASSMLPDGLLAGNLVDLGAYDECVDVAYNDGIDAFHGQHCMVGLSFIFNGSSPNFIDPVILTTLGNKVGYTFSVCLPSVCTQDLVSSSLVAFTDALNPLVFQAHNISLHLTVGDTDCHIGLREPWTTTEVMGILVTFFFVTVAVVCTAVELTMRFFDKISPDEELPSTLKLVTSFSMYANGVRLLDTTVTDESIRSLHGLKFLSIVWVAYGHHVKVTAQAPLINLLALANYLKYWRTMLILNAPLSVDVFFVISGVLNTFTYLNTSSRASKTLLGHVFGYLHRYIRLTPAYGLMILVTSTWLYRVGDGPLWDQQVGAARQQCTANWWVNFLYVNNYYHSYNNCMLQSWYLSADMQLFWISPLVLYFLWRWPRVGLLNLAAFVVLSIVVPFLVAFYDEIKAPIPISFDQNQLEREMTELYFPTHTKSVGYFMGMYVGYLLHLVRRKGFTFRIKPLTSVMIWLVAFAGMAWAVFGGYSFFQLDTPYNRWTSSLYIAFNRVFWSAGVAWFIIACTTGHGGFINTLLSWRGWMPLGRLTYCIYLTHVAVVLYSVGSMREPGYFSYYTMYLRFGGEFLLAIALAALLSLTIESPMMIAEKMVLGGGPRRRQSRKTSDHGIPPTDVSSDNQPTAHSSMTVMND